PMQGLRFRVNPVNGVTFPECDVQIAVGSNSEGAGTLQRRAADWGAFGSRRRLTRAGIGFDDSCVDMKATDTMIADVANQESTVAVEKDAVGLAELRLRSRTAV